MEFQSIEQALQFNDERFTKVDVIKNKRSVAFVLNFLPGQQMKPHNHPNRELFLHVIDGTGVFSIDGKDLDVIKGDVIYCDPKEQIGFINNGDQNVSIYATMTKLDG